MDKYIENRKIDNMRKLNLIVVFNQTLTKALFCIRAKEPYKGLYNFVGGKVEKNETNDELVEEKNKLEWVVINQELLNNEKFAGNYNIPHIISQIKTYLKNGTAIDKYQLHDYNKDIRIKNKEYNFHNNVNLFM